MRYLTFFLIFFLLHGKLFSQGNAHIPEKKIRSYLNTIEKKIQPIEKNLEKQNRVLLKKVSVLLQKISQNQKVGVWSEGDTFSNRFLSELSDLENSQNLPRYYNAEFDSILTMSKYLIQPTIFSLYSSKTQYQISDLHSRLLKVDSILNKAHYIKRILKSNSEFINEKLHGLIRKKDLLKFNKEIYYFSELLNKYNSVLKDKSKIQEAIINLALETGFLKEFMRKHSFLASLFNIPSNSIDPLNYANLTGLQSRVQLNQLIQQQINAGGNSGVNSFSQNIQAAQSQITNLRNQVFENNLNSSEDIMPKGFKPNAQKTKSFWEKLEIGSNLQTQKASGFFPTTSDIGLSLGYKFHSNGVVGVGGSYKLGLGDNLRNIKITHQGVGIRSFFDWKANFFAKKIDLWISGGYEMNYRNLNTPSGLNFQDFKWQESGLIGIAKTFRTQSKFIKNTKLQLLWDFLSYQQIPKTQPILFRIGYSF